MKVRMKSKDVKNRDFYITSIPDTTMNQDGDTCPLEPEEEYVVIKKEKLQDTLPILNEMTFENMGTTAKRAVTKLSWNGPIMDFKGYYYLEDMPLPNEDVIKKSLLLINQAGETLLFPLMDISIHEERLNIDRKSTRLNSSHVSISYAVFCLKTKIINSYII